MFQSFSEHRTILVTGPQRSGTRITAKMIAHDTGHRYVDEVEFHADSAGGLHAILQNTTTPIVVQAPALCHVADAFGFDAVVMCKRDVSDIVASQKRIGWACEPVELLHYNRFYTGPIAGRKYERWEHYQKRYIKNCYEVEYESLSAHPLWIDKEQRRDFGWSQTK